MRQLAVALLSALAVASALILLYGQSPLHVYAVMLSHTWGDAYGFGQVLSRATPLIFTGLAVAVAFQGGLFNIGGEGQLIAGSLGAALVGAGLPPGTPWLFAIPAACLAAAVAGGLVGALPGALKARFGAHEVITTIMLNFIVQAVVLGAGRRWLFVEQTVHTPAVIAAARLPGLPWLGDTAASWAFAIALVAAAACQVFVYRSRRGFELRALGKSPAAAQAGGVAVGATIVGVMTVSGALCGLVGTATVLGYKGYYEDSLGSGTGFMGISVALLARRVPLAMIPAALVFGTLAQGGLAANALVPKEIIDVMTAVVILAAAAQQRGDK